MQKHERIGKMLMYMAAAFFAAAIICGILAAITYYNLQEAEAAFDMLRNSSLQGEADSEAAAEDAGGIVYTEVFPDALLAENSDLAAWIVVPGTGIDYPVMHTPEDEEYYLHRDFYGKYSISGVPFAAAECSFSPLSRYMILYGHNMKNGTMFAGLKNYLDVDFAEEYSELKLLLPGGNVISYEVMTAAQVKVDSEEAEVIYSLAGSPEMDEYDAAVKLLKKISMYDTGVSAEYGDDLLILSTCLTLSEDARLVVVGCRKE